MMNRRKYELKGVLLAVSRRVVGAEELKKFLSTVAKKGTYYISEMECIRLQQRVETENTPCIDY